MQSARKHMAEAREKMEKYASFKFWKGLLVWTGFLLTCIGAAGLLSVNRLVNTSDLQQKAYDISHEESGHFGGGEGWRTYDFAVSIVIICLVALAAIVGHLVTVGMIRKARRNCETGLSNTYNKNLIKGLMLGSAAGAFVAFGFAVSMLIHFSIQGADDHLKGDHFAGYEPAMPQDDLEAAAQAMYSSNMLWSIFAVVGTAVQVFALAYLGLTSGDVCDKYTSEDKPLMGDMQGRARRPQFRQQYSSAKQWN
jgi:hypothetical protein